MAIERCHQRHAVFLAAGGRNFQLRLRPHRRRIAPHRRRPDLGCVSVRRRRRVEPDLGARTPQPCARRVPRIARPCRSFIPGKSSRKFIFVIVLEALMAPLFIIFYKLRPLGPAWELLPIAVLGTWALVVNGTFFAALSIRTKNREIMLPLLLFPISLPALLGMVNATTAVLTGEESAKFWIALLLAYDVVFTIACLLLFETILEAE